VAQTAQSRSAPSQPAQFQAEEAAFAYSGLPMELRLLLRCVRWPSPEADVAEIRALIVSGQIDWQSFLALCGHHRVMPLVYRALSSAAADVPASILATLKAAATENAMRAFRYLTETRRLCDLLQQAGVSVRVLKGVPLSQCIFSDPSVRDVGDIDLLIAPGMEETADRVLLGDGFHRDEPEARLPAPPPLLARAWQGLYLSLASQRFRDRSALAALSQSAHARQCVGRYRSRIE
jgi:hypothetical protein